MVVNTKEAKLAKECINCTAIVFQISNKRMSKVACENATNFLHIGFFWSSLIALLVLAFANMQWGSFKQSKA